MTGRRVTVEGCSCCAWVGDDNAVHVLPCSTDHEYAIERAARELGEQLAIEVVVDDFGDRPGSGEVPGPAPTDRGGA